jgi:hypothetical protein
MSVDKDLIARKPDLASDSGRLSQSYSFVDWIQFVRLINVSEIALAALQVLQLNPHRSLARYARKRVIIATTNALSTQGKPQIVTD